MTHQAQTSSYSTFMFHERMLEYDDGDQSIKILEPLGLASVVAEKMFGLV